MLPCRPEGANVATDRTAPDGEAPDPSRWPEPEWDISGQMAALRRRDDAYETNALAHYIREGHPYVTAWRSANAVPWIDHGQYVIFIRVDDSNELWRIRDRLKRERE